MAASNQSQQDDGGLTPLWIATLLFIAGFIAWYALHDQIVGFVIKLKLYQVYALNFFVPGLASMKATLSSISPQDYASINYDALRGILEAVGRILRYPVAVILIILAVILYTSSATLRYKRTLNMQSLTEQEVLDWPQITPVAQLDLVKEHPEQGAWAMGLTPMQFAKKHRLLLEQREAPTAESLSPKDKVTVVVLRAAAYQVFAVQLGAYWQGPDQLPPHVQALFAIFAARIAGDRQGAAKLVSQIAASAKFDANSRGKAPLNFAGVSELLKKHKDNKLAAKVMRQHAFVNTVMASMLMTARNDGVLASADFLWLKLVDRQLWFMLNSVGRKTPFAEVAGIFAHWHAELLLEQPIKIPVIEEAINGLELAISEVIYVPEEGSQ